jgi:hypothetical protein
MFSSSPNHLRAQVMLLLLAALAGCAEDLVPEGDESETETISTVPLPDGGFTTRVNASASDVWVYFSFVSNDQVIPLDPPNSSDWDLAFQRFHIITNGGASGNGGASVAVVADQAFADVVAAPAEGYVADQPDGDDSDTVVNSAFEEGDGWYAYDEMTNRLSPRPLVYVIRTARGAHYKLSLLDYYDAAGSSGHPIFSWAEL